MTPNQRLNILLADDGSQHAKGAVEWLQSISLPPESRVFVVRIFHSGQIPLIPEFERALERTRDRLSNRGYHVETELQLGHPGGKIIEMAEAREVDLILLGAKGLRSTVSILLGGVAQHVMEYASCPVLVMRAPFRGFSRILLVTDGSPSSQCAAHYLSKFPLPTKVDVRVMHVMSPIQTPLTMEPYYGAWQTVYAAYPTQDELERLETSETQLGETLLKRTCSQLQCEGIESMPVLTRGDAATEIIDYAKTNQIDLIVAGSRGLSQFKSLWVGSVSRKLVHYSDRSVLIVKAPMKE